MGMGVITCLNSMWCKWDKMKVEKYRLPFR
jgi:hypothetical protein